MARGRLISQDCARDPHLNALSLESELLYLLTLPHLDRDGLVDGDPTLLAAVAAPRRTALRDGAGNLINEWVEAGMVVRYTWRDGPILFFKGFRKHNPRLRYEDEPASRFPPPPAWRREPFGLCPDDPDLAANVALGLDSRSSYARGLLAYAQRAQNLDKEMLCPASVQDGPASHQLCTKTGPITSRSRSTSIQPDEDDGGPVPAAAQQSAAALAHDIARDITGWTGAGKFLDELAPAQLLDALTWLWLWDLHHNTPDPVEHLQIEQRYKGDPFKGVKSIPGKIITQVRRGNAAPLLPRDLEALQTYLAGG